MTSSNLFLSRRQGSSIVGLLGVALTSVLLLCGAGNVPVENFTPQGAMQKDLNAGGHGITNVATLNATNVAVSGTLTATNFTLPFTNVTSTPTNIAGYGITDAYTRTQINSLLPASVTGPRFGNGTNVDTAESSAQAATALIGNALGAGQATALAAPSTAVPISITGSAAATSFPGIANRPSFYPSDIAGLQLWIDPAKQTLTDGATVSSLTDSSGAGTSLVQATAANQPTFKQSGINGLPACLYNGSTDLMTTSFNLDSAWNTAFTIALVYQNNNFTTAQLGFYGGTDNRVFAVIGNTANNYGNGAVDSATAGAEDLAYVGSPTAPTVYVLSYDGTTIRIWMNGCMVVAQPTTASIASSVALQIGKSNAQYFSGYFGDVLLYRHGATLAEGRLLSRYLLQKYNFPPRQIIFVGDSLSSSVHATSGTGLPATVNLLGGFSQWTATNFGIPSEYSSGITALLNNGEVAGVLAGTTDRLAVYWAGTNDINSGGQSAAAVEANIAANCTTLRAAGYKVIVATLLPYGAGTFESVRQSCNALILANWTTFADGVADFGDDAAIGAAGAQTSATYYYTDNIHLSAAGYAVTNQILANAINKILKRPVTLTGTLSGGTCTVTNATILAGSVVTPTHLGTSTTNAGALYTVSVNRATGGLAGNAVIKSTSATDNDTIQISVQ